MIRLLSTTPAHKAPPRWHAALAHTRNLVPSRCKAWRARPLLHPPQLIGLHRNADSVIPEASINLIYGRDQIVSSWVRSVEQGQLPWYRWRDARQDYSGPSDKGFSALVEIANLL